LLQNLLHFKYSTQQVLATLQAFIDGQKRIAAQTVALFAPRNHVQESRFLGRFMFIRLFSDQSDLYV
jgi:hypothetical protein